MEQNENNIKTESKTRHSDAIRSIGILLIVMGIIAGVILGCLYKIATYNDSYSIPDYTFNWGLAIMTAIVFVVFSLIFFALAHMTVVQEETRDLLLEIKEQ